MEVLMKVLTKNTINIHTIEFSYYKISDKDHEKLIHELIPAKQNRTNAKDKYFNGQSQFRGIRYKYHIINKSDYQSRILHVIINPRDLLGKDTLVVEDLDEFMNRYRFLLYQEFSMYTLESEIFTRIDYFIDIEYEPAIKKELLKIYKKAPSNYRGLQKKDRYKSSIYYNSKSRQINVYSRLEKMIEKIIEENYIHPSKVDLKKEIMPFISKQDKNVIRYEVQIKRKKIMYHFKTDGITPELINYWNERDAAYFINDILKPIIFNGDYYNKYHSKKKLMEYYKNKKLVEKLIKFQNCISKHGADNAKKRFKNYCKYINMLVEASVNPVLIPNNAGITKIKNPFQFYKKSADIYKIPAKDWHGIIKEECLSEVI